MEEQDYLIHYGVLGMKWGVRKAQKKGTNYSYTSMRTKSLTKRAANAKDKGKKNAGKLAEKAKISKQTDKKLLAYAKKTSTGKALAQDLLLGPMGAKSYATMRATGSSRKKAMATQIISRSAGIALGIVLGGATGAMTAKYPSLADQMALYNTIMKGKTNVTADVQMSVAEAVKKFSDQAYQSARVAAGNAGALKGAIYGDGAGAANAISRKKTVKKKKTTKKKK